MTKLFNSKITYLVLGIALTLVVIGDIITTHIGIEIMGFTEQNQVSVALLNNGWFYPLKVITLIMVLGGLFVGYKAKQGLKIALVSITTLATITLLIVDILNLVGILW